MTSSPVNFPHKGQWLGPLMFSLICPLNNSWANNGDAGDLRHHRAHYALIMVFVMYRGDFRCRRAVESLSSRHHLQEINDFSDILWSQKQIQSLTLLKSFRWIHFTCVCSLALLKKTKTTHILAYTAGKCRNDNVIITSKRRCNGVVTR